MGGLTVVCYGVCGGIPGWVNPETGFHCSLCMGSGKVETRDHAKDEIASYEKQKAKRAHSQMRPRKTR